jgi:TonB family protein
MRYFFVVLVISLWGLSPVLLGQEQAVEVRKAIHKTAPKYPEIAIKMNIGGTVKLIAVVAPDGKVKSVETVGGSPLLIQAARSALAEWKFAPAGTESKETIEMHFEPPKNDSR